MTARTPAAAAAGSSRERGRHRFDRCSSSTTRSRLLSRLAGASSRALLTLLLVSIPPATHAIFHCFSSNTCAAESATECPFELAVASLIADSRDTALHFPRCDRFDADCPGLNDSVLHHVSLPLFIKEPSFRISSVSCGLSSNLRTNVASEGASTRVEAPFAGRDESAVGCSAATYTPAFTPFTSAPEAVFVNHDGDCIGTPVEGSCSAQRYVTRHFCGGECLFEIDPDGDEIGFCESIRDSVIPSALCTSYECHVGSPCEGCWISMGVFLFLALLAVPVATDWGGDFSMDSIDFAKVAGPLLGLVAVALMIPAAVLEAERAVISCDGWSLGAPDDGYVWCEESMNCTMSCRKGFDAVALAPARPQRAAVPVVLTAPEHQGISEVQNALRFFPACTSEKQEFPAQCVLREHYCPALGGGVSVVGDSAAASTTAVPTTAAPTASASVASPGAQGALGDTVTVECRNPGDVLRGVAHLKCVEFNETAGVWELDPQEGEDDSITHLPFCEPGNACSLAAASQQSALPEGDFRSQISAAAMQTCNATQHLANCSVSSRAFCGVRKAATETRSDNNTAATPTTTSPASTAAATPTASMRSTAVSTTTTVATMGELPLLESFLPPLWPSTAADAVTLDCVDGELAAPPPDCCFLSRDPCGALERESCGDVAEVVIDTGAPHNKTELYLCGECRAEFELEASAPRGRGLDGPLDIFPGQCRKTTFSLAKLFGREIPEYLFWVLSGVFGLGVVLTLWLGEALTPIYVTAVVALGAADFVTDVSYVLYEEFWSEPLLFFAIVAIFLPFVGFASLVGLPGPHVVFAPIFAVLPFQPFEEVAPGSRRWLFLVLTDEANDGKRPKLDPLEPTFKLWHFKRQDGSWPAEPIEATARLIASLFAMLAWVAILIGYALVVGVLLLLGAIGVVLETVLQGLAIGLTHIGVALGTVFILIPLYYTLGFCVGFILFQTRLLTVQPVLELFMFLWTGDEEVVKRFAAPSDGRVLNQEVFFRIAWHEWVFESILMTIVQVANNTLQLQFGGPLSPLAMASMVITGYFVLQVGYDFVKRYFDSTLKQNSFDSMELDVPEFGCSPLSGRA